MGWSELVLASPVHVRADITQWVLPGLGILAGTLGGLRQQVKPRGPNGDDDSLFVGVNVSGSSTTHQRDRELTLHGGEAFIAMRGTSGFAIVRPGLVRFIGLRLPRAAVAPLVANLDDVGIRPIPRGTDALRLMTG